MAEQMAVLQGPAVLKAQSMVVLVAEQVAATSRCSTAFAYTPHTHS